MIIRTFESAGQVMWRPGVLVPSAAATIGSHVVFRWFAADDAFWTLSAAAMWLISAVVVARFWIGLSVSMTALNIVRGNYRWRPFRFVSSSVALQAAVVSTAIALPILAATLFLIVPGVFLALRWSQAAMLLADGRSKWFGSAEDSADLVHGRRLEVLSIWLIIGAALVTVAWMTTAATGLASIIGAPTIMVTGLTLLVRVAVDAFSLVVVATMYHELDREAGGDTTQAAVEK